MKKSIVLCALVSLFLASIQASALTISGVDYRAVPKATKTCRNGKKPVLKSGINYCRIYKASIGWNMPVKRINGTALRAGEIKGYEVYWTRTKDSRSGVIKVAGSSLATSLAVFTPDTYHIAVSAVDTKGLKSPLSKVVSAKIM